MTNGVAKIDVIVSPWAQVRVDGKSVGTTPVRGLQVPAGRRVVELQNDELGKRERVVIKADPDEQLRIRRDWLAP